MTDVKLPEPAKWVWDAIQDPREQAVGIAEAMRAYATAAVMADRAERWRAVAETPKDGSEFQGLLRTDDGFLFWEPRCKFDDDTLHTYGRVDYDMDGWEAIYHAKLIGWMPQPPIHIPPPAEDGDVHEQD